MLEMDEMIAQTPLKYLAQVELVLERIPTKALYKIQVSVVQEVQSRARTDSTYLQHMKNGKEELEFVIEQIKFETKEEKERADMLEQGLNATYNQILNNVHAVGSSTEDKIKLITQTIDRCMQEIKELKEKLNPTTPPKVREKRKTKAILQLVEMEKQVNTTT
jgi:hypothetical protein